MTKFICRRDFKPIVIPLRGGDPAAFC